MRRIKLVLGVLALLSVLLVMTAAPAIADDDKGRDCFPFCDNDRHAHHNGEHNNGDDEEDVDVDVEGPFLVDDEVCVFVVTEEEDHDGDEDVDVEEKCVEPQFTALSNQIFQPYELPLPIT